MAHKQDFSTVVDGARKAFNSGRTKSIEFRKRQLIALAKLLDENEDAICTALNKDMAKSNFEGYVFDIHVTREEIVQALENIDEWVKPEKVKADFLNSMAKLSVRKEPYGVCLIIGAWNFPILLLLSPLVGAIVAGNSAVLKPSELTEHTAKLLSELIPRYLDKECYPVVIAGPEGSSKLLNEYRFDFIFYTGGTVVGKLIMAAAAKNLTPVVLELGGKNPCIVNKDADLKQAAERICFGRFMNAGQICLSPDYVLCEDEIRDQLVEQMRSAIEKNFGEDPKSSRSYPRIINDRHFSRVRGLMSSGKTAIGGQTDESQRYIAPTVLIDVPTDSPVMQEEVFGPVLPILTVKNIGEAIKVVNARERPLALYVFSKSKQLVDHVLRQTSSGGVTINDCLMHHNQFQPFGGIGHSGMGNYHGKYSYETFTHRRACFDQTTPNMLLSVRYPPYSEKTLKRIKGMKKRLPGQEGPFDKLKRLIKLAVLAVLIAYVLQNFVMVRN